MNNSLEIEKSRKKIHQFRIKNYVCWTGWAPRYGIFSSCFLLYSIYSKSLQSNESCQSCGTCSEGANDSTTSTHHNGNSSKQQLLGTPRRPHVEFDHLSIVSEESQRSPNDDGRLQPPALDAKSKIPDSPLGDLQSVMPPLKHFENIQYESVGPGNVGKTLTQFFLLCLF